MLTQFATINVSMARPGLICANAHLLQRTNHIGEGGTINGISSQGVNPSLYRPDRTYSATGSGKTVMEYRMRLYAKAVAKHNINVNHVVRGLVQTSEWDKQEKYRENAPETTHSIMQRLVENSTAFGVVALLYSPAGSFIRGTTLPVHGGMHINCD